MAEEASSADLPPPYPGLPDAQGKAPYPPLTQQPPYPTAGQQMPYPPAGQPAPYPTAGQPAPYPAGQYSQMPYTAQQTTTARTTVVTTHQPTANTVIVAGIGGCPNCRVGILEERFTCCGICLGIFFFPLGLICCLMWKTRTCTHCHMTY